MLPFLGERFGNPSSHHTVGEAAASVLSDARRRVAAVFGMRPPTSSSPRVAPKRTTWR
jgi:cysteine desulfurase